MDILEAAMAFAVVMIILSTIATGVTELILRMLGMRQAGLQRALNRLYKDIIQPRLNQELADLARQNAEAGDMTRAPKRFREDMQRNPAARSKGTGFLNFFTGERRVDVLSVVAFAQRLGKTDVGKAILAQGEEQIELLVQDFSRSFERYSTAAREAYRRNAQVWAMLIGIAVAFAMNVDAYRVYENLVSNEELRKGLVASSEKIVEAKQAAMKSLEDAISSEGATKNDLELIKAKLVEMRKAMGSEGAIAKYDLPIGWQYHEMCSGKPNCGFSTDEFFNFLKNDWEKSVRWFGLTLMSGILIGLGGPFWFQVFTSLSHLFQLLKALGMGKPNPAVQPEQVEQTDKAEESVKPETVVEAFKVAAQVAHSGAKPVRAILGPNGQPL